MPLPLLVQDAATGAWTRLCDVCLEGAVAGAAPASLRVVSYQRPLPAISGGSGASARVILAPDADKKAAKHFTAFLTNLLRGAAGTSLPKAAVLDWPAHSTAFLLAAEDAASATLLLQAAQPEKLPALGAKRRRADDVESIAPGGAPPPPRPPPTVLAAPSAPPVPAPRSSYAYIVYPENRGDLVVAALVRRQPTGSWTDALGGASSTDRGYWRAVEAAVIGGSWDFVWKPTVGFSSKSLPLPPLPPGVTPSLHMLPTRAQPPSPVLNHMPQTRCISSKASLWRSLSAWYGGLGWHPCAAALPTTFLVPLHTLAPEAVPGGSSSLAEFRERFEAIRAAAAAVACGDDDASSAEVGDSSSGDRALAAAERLMRAGERVPLQHVLCNMWICKPEHLYAGQGIELADDVAGVDAFVACARGGGAGDAAPSGRTTHAGSGGGGVVVIQKYLECPLLLVARGTGGRKFDVRVNVLLTDTWDVYVYRHAFCRTSSVPYSATEAASRSDKAAHITNNCYQQGSTSFGAHEEGNILSLGQLQAYLDAAYPENGGGSGEGRVSVARDLFPRWVEIILDVLCANRARSVAGAGDGRAGRKRWFELLGFDFLVDAHFRSWLLEANINPSLDFHCSYTERLYSRLIDETLALTVDKWLPLAGGPPPPLAGDSNLEAPALPWLAAVAPLPVPAWMTRRSLFVGATGEAALETAAAAALSLPPPSTELPASGGWELVWSETAPPAAFRAIPHQAAMAPHAVNSGTVVRVLDEEERLGRPLCDAEARAAAAAAADGAWIPAALDALVRPLDGEGAVEPPVAGPGATAASWRAVARRFVRRRDAAWLYPHGAPPDVIASLSV